MYVVVTAGQLCQDILHKLLNLRLLRKSHLQLLLVPQITEINFAATYANTISAQALDILTLRCKVFHHFMCILTFIHSSVFAFMW